MHRNTKTSRPHLSPEQAARIYKVSPNSARHWRSQGVDLGDATAVVRHIFSMTRRPVPWRDVLGDDTGESLDDLKRRRLLADARRLEIQNEAREGRLIPMEDALKVQAAATEALKRGLEELRANAAQTLAGRDEGGIDSWFDEAIHQLRTNLSDLESDLWRETLEALDLDPEADEE